VPRRVSYCFKYNCDLMSSRKLLSMQDYAGTRRFLCLKSALIAGSFSLTLGGRDESSKKNRRRRTEGVAQRRRRGKGLNDQSDHAVTVGFLGVHITARITVNSRILSSVGNSRMSLRERPVCREYSFPQAILPVHRSLSDAANYAGASFASSEVIGWHDT
jgi:hypothetical protein